jgi:ATP-dependent DNA helicase PIF1
VLEKRRTALPKDDIIHLVSSNYKARTINQSRLSAIKGESHVYPACYTTDGIDQDMCEFLRRDIHNQFEKRGLNEIELKRGARVILIKNIDVDLGLVNGSAGTIESFVMDSGVMSPQVKFDNGTLRVITPTTWDVDVKGASCTVSQIPLMLGWSVTIHKSQSLTLDRAVLDLADCFAEAQVYVALSRLRSLDGLYLQSFDPKKIKVNETVLDYVNQLEKFLKKSR